MCSAPAGAHGYRFRWPCTIFLTFLFWEPRATPEARFGLGAAFLRAARFTFLRSALSVMFLVFIQLFFNPAYFSTSFFKP